MPDDHDQPSPPAESIYFTIKPLGTIIFHGTVVVRDVDGNAITPPVFKQPGVIKFCGCGRSATKPFCDGSHKKAVNSEG